MNPDFKITEVNPIINSITEVALVVCALKTSSMHESLRVHEALTALYRASSILVDLDCIYGTLSKADSD